MTLCLRGLNTPCILNNLITTVFKSTCQMCGDYRAILVRVSWLLLPLEALVFLVCEQDRISCSLQRLSWWWVWGQKPENFIKVFAPTCLWYILAGTLEVHFSECILMFLFDLLIKLYLSAEDEDALKSEEFSFSFFSSLLSTAEELFGMYFYV